MPKCSGLSGHNEQTPMFRVPLQTGLQFHSRGYEQPPHQRAYGITNSRWLAGDHCTSSDNNLRFGRLNSSSNDLRADAVVGRPSSTPPHEERGQAIRAKDPGVRSQVAPTVSSAETTSSSCHHLSTDDSGHLPTNTAPASDSRPKAHWQVLTPALATRTRTGPSQNTSTALAAYDVLCDPPVQPAIVARAKDEQLHPGRAAAVRLPPHGWRTPPPHSWRMPLSPERRRKKRVAGPRKGRPQLAPPSSPAQMMKILEAEGGAEAAARLASPHHKADDHPYG
jgi:hypothetical protein